MLRGIHLYGRLGEEFGIFHRFDADTVGEAVRALASQFKGFLPSLRKGSYQVIRGSNLEGEEMSEPMLGLTLGRDDLHLVPVIEGAKQGGAKPIISAVLGVALVATAFIMAPAGGMAATMFNLPAGLGAVSFSQVALFGAAMALGGIWQLIAPMPTVSDYNAREQDKKVSFVFGGAVNRMEQGGALQVVYGRFRVGSTVVSAGIDIQELLSPETTFNITVTGDEHALPDVTGDIAVKYNQNYTARIHCSRDYTIDKVVVDGEETSNYVVNRSATYGLIDMQYSFWNVKQAHTLHVTSRLLQPYEYPTDPYGGGQDH